MRKLDVPTTHRLLSRIMEFELAGVVRYTHYSLMVTGPNRIPIVQFMKGQATESLLHAQQAGEILTGLDGHPSLRIAPIAETYKHAMTDILRESLLHEETALELYKELLDVVKDASVYIEEFARQQIGQEELHMLELRKMLRDITQPVDGHEHAPFPERATGGGGETGRRPRSIARRTAERRPAERPAATKARGRRSTKR